MCFFCQILDLMIDDQKSTRVVESWEGHKIILHCVVKKVLHDAPVRFYWLQQNRTLPGPQTSWKTLGQVSLVTVNDQDFEPVTCAAETEATTQRMEINIKRLCKCRFSAFLCLLTSCHVTSWTIFGKSLCPKRGWSFAKVLDLLRVLPSSTPPPLL